MSAFELSELIGKNIVFQRKKIGLSQKELAAKLDISYESLSRIERGVTYPKMTRLNELAEILQCSIASLFQNETPSLKDRALAIAESVESLPQQKQEAFIQLMYSTVDVLKIKD